MAKKKARPRLKVGDRVKVIKVPENNSYLKKLVGRVGSVAAPRDQYAMWRVRLKNGDEPFFFRCELKKL